MATVQLSENFMYRYVYHINSVYKPSQLGRCQVMGVRINPLISSLPVYYQFLLPLRATISIIVISCLPRKYQLCRMSVCSSRTSPSYVMGTLTICEEVSSTFISADRCVCVCVDMYIYISRYQIFERVTI